MWDAILYDQSWHCGLWSFLHVATAAHVGASKKRVAKFFDAYCLAGAGGMDKPAVADVHANVRNALPAVGGEEDQVSLNQFVFGHPTAGLELIAGYPRQIQAVKAVADHGQTAAVETFGLVGSAPTVGDADETPRRFNQFVP